MPTEIESNNAGFPPENFIETDIKITENSKEAQHLHCQISLHTAQHSVGKVP